MTHQRKQAVSQAIHKTHALNRELKDTAHHATGNAGGLKTHAFNRELKDTAQHAP